MREIKFRAFLKEQKKMFPVTYLTLSDEEGEQVGVATCNREGCVLCVDYYDLEKVELMQYTGSKDKNGREIHEGDIVKRIEKTGYTFIGAVIYEEYGFGIKSYGFFKPLSKKGKYDDGKSSFDYSVEYEIIGNIYENHELLEVSK